MRGKSRRRDIREIMRGRVGNTILGLVDQIKLCLLL